MKKKQNKLRVNKQRFMISIVVIFAIILLIFFLTLRNSLLLVKNSINQIRITTSPTLLISPTIISSGKTFNLSQCGTEGSAQDLQKKENIIMGVKNIDQFRNEYIHEWEPDAYRISIISNIDLIQSTNPSSNVYASSCTKDLLTLTGGFGGPQQIAVLKPHDPNTPWHLLFDYDQLDQNFPLPENADQQFLFPSSNYFKITSQWKKSDLLSIDEAANEAVNNQYVQITVNGVTVPATSYAMQINNSRTKGLIFEITMLYFGKPEARMIYDNNANLITFKKL